MQVTSQGLFISLISTKEVVILPPIAHCSKIIKVFLCNTTYCNSVNLIQ